MQTASVGTRVTEDVSGSDPDPGLNGTIRYNLVQRLPDSAFVSPCTCSSVHACMYAQHISLSLLDPPRVSTLR